LQAPQAASLLAGRGLVKSFDDRPALRGITFDLLAGEVLGVVGENGAGKSTLLGILSGALAPDAGEIFVGARGFPRLAPRTASELGIATVHQDLMLARNLDAAANIFMGREVRRTGTLGRLGVLDELSMAEQAHAALAAIGVELSVEERRLPVRSLSGGQRQAVAIARALRLRPRILLLDEPIAALDVGKRRLLAAQLRTVTAAGGAVLVTLHDPDDLEGLADRAFTLRSGRIVG
jgi:ABC-type sugar transport system ATPase subunit